MADEYLAVDDSPVSHADVKTVSRYLDHHGVGYKVIEHPPTETARSDARASSVPPAHTAKTVVLSDAASVYVLAVVPASEQVDLHKLRALIGETKALQLATESDMAQVFSAFEVGAVPPVGAMVFADEVVDRRLLEHDRILCGGGDHRHSILLDPHELVRVAEARVGDICQD